MTRNIPQRELPSGLSVVPDSATDVIAVDAWVQQITVNNVTSSDTTITITDKNSKTLCNAVPVYANTAPLLIVFPYFVKMTGGISWVAGATDALHAEIVGFYNG